MSLIITNPQPLSTVRNLDGKEVTCNPRLLVSAVDMCDVLGSFEYHTDMIRQYGTWRYENPGISPSGRFNYRSVFSRTGVNFTCVGKDNAIPFDIPSDSKELWIKFDALGSSTSTTDDFLKFFAEDEDGNVTGIHMAAIKTSYNDAYRLIVNGVEVRKEYSPWRNSGNFYGLHSFKLHLVSDASNGKVEVFFDSNAVYTIYTGNVGNGKAWSKVYCYEQPRGSGGYVTFSNIIISNIGEPDINEIVKSNAEFRYENYGTADKLTIAGTTVQTDTMSRTGSAFYQTKRSKCFDVPTTDEVWIQFDLYHKEGTSRFRCYGLTSGNTTGICLKENTNSEVAIFINGTNQGVASKPLIPNTIQTYLVHMKYNADLTTATVELWMDGEKVASYTASVSGWYFSDFYLQSDNANNLFSNVTISNVPKVITHADIMRTARKLNEVDIDAHNDISVIIANDNNVHADTLVNRSKSIVAHADINRTLLESYHHDTLVYRSDSVSLVHASTVRLLSRDLDGFGEGVATCKRIDLGAEMNVGIGIFIEGEGYAKIRTAGSDGAYTGWEDYVPCERLCRYIDVQLHVRMKITQASIVVDRRAVSVALSKHLSAGENTISYGETFYNVPAVIPTAIGENVTANVISKTEKSCVIKIVDSDGKAVEGDVDILIRGW